MFDRVEALDPKQSDIAQLRFCRSPTNGVDAPPHPLEAQIISFWMRRCEPDQERAFAATDIEFERRLSIEKVIHFQACEVILGKNLQMSCRFGQPIEFLGGQLIHDKSEGAQSQA